ncbi:MAG: cupin domain-containing protein, partial [Caldithrix sp.]
MSYFKNIPSRVRFSIEKMQKVNLFETRNFFCDIYCLEPGQ